MEGSEWARSWTALQSTQPPGAHPYDPQYYSTATRGRPANLRLNLLTRSHERPRRDSPNNFDKWKENHFIQV